MAFWIDPEGAWMNVRWVRSNAVLLAFLVVVMVVVGVLAVLVVRQQQDQATDNGRVYLQTAPAADAASGANTPDPANVLTKPDAPSPVGTGEAARVEAPAKDQTSGSADQPVNSDKPPREVTRETARVEAPAKDQTSDSRHRDSARAAG
ncbi:MAG: hypothetical protein M3380_17340 [Chloroflexota bacterium]|nr:hypothetical protein [Chloroflexota bacterium]